MESTCNPSLADVPANRVRASSGVRIKLPMRESELLAHIYARSAALSRQFPQVIAGPGHDCAVIAIGSEQVLLKVDQVVAGRHFRESTPIDLIARKAMARAVSDIGATGGTPVAALCAAVLPADYPHADELFDAMAKWGMHFGCPLVGGDISTGAALVLSVTVVGRPHSGRGPVLRSGAHVGDGVYITGELGGSFENLTGMGRHLTFEPRLKQAAVLCDTLGARLHAMMDVSDGLGRDAGRLAAASGVGIALHESRLPVAPGLGWKQAVGDGEDYELLFAASGAVPEQVAGTRLTRIGEVVEGGGAWLTLQDGKRVEVSETGWEHGQS
jgi:thiamine-monophosphate kinase